MQKDGAAVDSTTAVTLTQSGEWEYIKEVADVAVADIPTSGDVYCHISDKGVVTITNSK